MSNDQYITSINQVEHQTAFLDSAKLVPIMINDSGVVKDVKEYKGIYNVSRGKFCGTVTDNYNLVQHNEYFESVGQSLLNLGIKFNMRVQQSGNSAMCDINFVGRDIKFEKLNEEFATGLRLINSYDKTTGISVMPRFTRLACTNGMVLSRYEHSFSYRHNSIELKQLESFVEKQVNLVIAKSQDLQLYVSNSMKDSVEWKLCVKIFEKLFEQLKHRTEILKRLGISVIEVWDKKTNKKGIEYVLDSDKDKDKKFTRWDIYNAITNYLTYGQQISPFIESMYQKKAERLLVTPLNEMPIKVEVI